ncbi:S-layer homology domain-containing protein [Paenibacillus sp. M1]|uniref:S-layer homology domain-containing protein n=1 Tax=Paenibacillus haidiansis TaxID=1574488 RepID=A0ABU7VXD5_9BACL
MQKKKLRSLRRITQVACTGLVAVSVWAPSGWAGAESDSVTVNVSSGTGEASGVLSVPLDSLSEETKLKIAAGEIPMPGAVAPDPALAQFSKEQAVEKVKELFPVLKDTASAERVDLGINNTYPQPENQMIWDIQWRYEKDNTVYGFTTQVDAMNGDLINAYLNLPDVADQAYYPPKLTREQALEAAKAFISEAAPSISLQDLKEQDVNYFGSTGESLFGPVQYGFYFQVMKSGIPTADYVNVSIDGNGNTVHFSKTLEHYVYPSAVPSISQSEALKIFADELSLELNYIPLYKDGELTRWILGYRPAEAATYPIDAHTGKRFSYQGEDVVTSPPVYTEVPATAKRFQPRTVQAEMTAEEAVALVQATVDFPDGRKLSYSTLNTDYSDPGRKVWRLYWEGDGSNSTSAVFPSQTVAEVDARTGEILEFSLEQYVQDGQQETPAPPAGAVKLTPETAKQKAYEFLNLLTPNASRDYRLVEQEGSTPYTISGAGYKYTFVRFFNGIPLSNAQVSVSFDLYGRLQNYSVGRNPGIDGIAILPSDAKLSKEEAAQAYLDKYTVELQYSSTGGHYVDNTYVKQQIRLAYTLKTKDPGEDYKVLNAVSGQWSTVYGNSNTSSTDALPSDIKGHWAEQELSALIEFGVITPDESGQVKPDAEITVGEWLTMMAASVTRYYKDYGGYYGMEEPKSIAGVEPESLYYDAVKFAAERDWIDRGGTLNMDAELTREQLAVMLASIVKYDKFAAFLTEDQSLSQFGDKSSIGSKGEVALAVKLGLLKGQNGQFNPKGHVTKAEAAAVIMNLVKLQGRIDQPISM